MLKIKELLAKVLSMLKNHETTIINIEEDAATEALTESDIDRVIYGRLGE